MNKKLITIIVVVFAILGAVIIGLYLLLSAGQTNTSELNSTENIQKTQVAQNTIKGLLASTGSQKCEYTDAQSSSSGIVYVGNGMMKGEFKVNSPQGMLSSYMYSDGTDIYVWMDGQPQGIMMGIEKMGQNNGTQQSEAQSVDVNKAFDFNCSQWSIDSSILTKPSSITFINLNEMPQGSGVPTSITPSCSACDMLPQAAQASCRAAIPGCS